MLGENIRRHRKLNNMSQDELAEKLNVTRQSVSLWENGQTQPSLENIVALAKLFQVSTDELLDSEKPEAPAANTVPAQEHPKKNSKILFLILGIAVVVVVLAIVPAFVLLGGDNNANNDPIITDPQTDTEGAPTVSDPQTDTEGAPTVSDPQTTQTAPEENTSPADTEEEPKDIFGYLKDFVIENGTINGDYCYYSKSADHYGGYASENFSLYYWGDTNKVEFCLHSVLDETFSINFYLYVPVTHSGKYEYVSSYYYRDTGEPLYQAEGTITAEEFTEKYPLYCTEYFGSTENQNKFMEMSRQGVCDLIACLEKFIEVEEIKYSFEDFGFLSFQADRD